ncbi:MAG: nickel pincer cofactor biosynthesis protein LarC [Cyclobacteriaceae bacterium]|nr:nickel pincer cofactor biosynthesis protein LarC [Cyclobacteriaceae bacterium]
MSKILKIEAFAGMSGDMFLGALSGLANAYEEIKKLPSLLHLENEVVVEVCDVIKTGIACKHVKIRDIKNEAEASGQKLQKKAGHQHDHDHHHHNTGHEHPHIHDHTHEHKHSHHETHRHQHHHHRHLKDIYKIIEQGHISSGTKEIAKQIFLLLGEAESLIHGIPLEKIHFHEVGAIDSIMDIVGTAWLLDKLGIEKTYSTPVATGFGFAMTEHGRLPVPCPATQMLLHGIPAYPGDQKGEMTTPTGAAILKYLKPVFDMPVLTETKTSYGPGEKDFEIPNTLRLSLCEPAQKKDEIMVLQTNIDDFPAEYLGMEFQESLYEQGALDVYLQQVIMKKGRPGFILNVMCQSGQQEMLANVILEKTSSIGIRYFPVKRYELKRELLEFDTIYGKVNAKEVSTPSGKKRMKIESRDLLRISKEQGYSPAEMHSLLLRDLENRLENLG